MIETTICIRVDYDRVEKLILEDLNMETKEGDKVTTKAEPEGIYVVISRSEAE